MLWLEYSTICAAPSARLKRVLACSSATGLRFCGMIELPCTRPSPSRYQPDPAQESRSHTKRLRFSATLCATLTTSASQSELATAS